VIVLRTAPSIPLWLDPPDPACRVRSLNSDEPLRHVDLKRGLRCSIRQTNNQPRTCEPVHTIRMLGVLISIENRGPDPTKLGLQNTMIGWNDPIGIGGRLSWLIES
jgi:hypothetical protein